MNSESLNISTSFCMFTPLNQMVAGRKHHTRSHADRIALSTIVLDIKRLVCTIT
jgi:hypothetical protein